METQARLFAKGVFQNAQKLLFHREVGLIVEEKIERVAFHTQTVVLRELTLQLVSPLENQLLNRPNYLEGAEVAVLNYSP